MSPKFFQRICNLTEGECVSGTVYQIVFPKQHFPSKEEEKLYLCIWRLGKRSKMQFIISSERIQFSSR
ncbi:hypothetical protein XELAEV_18000048mg [Xenopus laevis]|uniref:Uncharacterized protein n=1 Tax=Xenopus laevis TaxID=8355 RepID=A0A974BQX3_XENLA|nr:hypothetical protein XELAEV_18000048mg [Xenopus laevis]